MYLELLLSDEDAVTVSAVEVSLPLDHSIVLPVGLVQLNTDPLPWSKPCQTIKPEGGRELKLRHTNKPGIISYKSYGQSLDCGNQRGGVRGILHC